MIKESHTMANKLTSLIVSIALVASLQMFGVTAWAKDGISDNVHQQDDLAQTSEDASLEDAGSTNADVRNN